MLLHMECNNVSFSFQAAELLSPAVKEGDDSPQLKSSSALFSTCCLLM